MMPSVTILQGDVLEQLRTLPPESVHCCVTSPPYWGLRDYGVAGQIGLEPTPEEYVAKMVEVFREVRRVLRPDGTCWINLGDSYVANGSNQVPQTKSHLGSGFAGPNRNGITGLKPKDLCGIPWRVARALQEPYYTGTIKNVEDRIWLAAMIDAEGCMFIHKRKAGTDSGAKFTKADGTQVTYDRTVDTYGPGLEICNTSKAIIDRVAAIVGGGTFTEQSPERNNRRKQTIYRWRIAPNEAKRIAQEVYPHLVAKQKQARLLFHCPSMGDAGAKAHQAMMDLHNGIDTSVDFPVPPSLFEPGWYLRQDVIWSKPNCMPESVTDRCTKAHEFIFLLTKSERYYFDAEAIKEPFAGEPYEGRNNGAILNGDRKDRGRTIGMTTSSRNKRSVWTVPSAPYPEAHFATYPPDLIKPCILAGTSARGCCPKCGAPWGRITEKGESMWGQRKANGAPMRAGDVEGGRSLGAVEPNFSGAKLAAWKASHPDIPLGWQPTCECSEKALEEGSRDYNEMEWLTDPVPCTVLDPFAGSFTTCAVALELGRSSIGVELNPAYVKLGRERCAITPGLNLGA